MNLVRQLADTLSCYDELLRVAQIRSVEIIFSQKLSIERNIASFIVS